MSKFQDIIGEALSFWLPGEERLENHRPPWLLGMEIDFLFPTLGLAVEVNGKQHYKRIPTMQTGPEHNAQRQRDARKKRIIAARGLKLIILRQKRSWVVCGLQSKLRESFPGRKFGLLPESIRADWKRHSARLHEFSVGRDRALSERGTSSN